MPVGNFTTESLQNKPSETWLGEYIKAWYDYIVGAIGIIAVVVVMWGGILWITSGGNSGQVSEAKGKIKNGVLGVFLLLISYTIFKTINPALLDLSLPKLTPVVEPPKVCCQKKSEDGKTPILRIRYNNCEDGETPLLNLTDCVIVKEATKKSMCPPGTHVITVKGPNDHPAFLEEAMDNCGANAYDPTTWHKLNNSLTTPVDGLKYYDGEYFGCYACTDPLRNELGPT
jgi:hypothetical protein